jgi:DNA-binding CsgD family transcriptional regulator
MLKEFPDSSTIAKKKANNAVNIHNINLLNQIDAFIFIMEIKPAKPIWINDYFRKAMGYTIEDLNEITPEKFLELFHPKSLTQFLNRIKNFDEVGEGIKTIYQLKTKTGSWIHLMISSRVNERNPDGSIKSLMGYAIEADANELYCHLRKLKDLNTKCENLTLLDTLTGHEMDIIKLIAQGMTDMQIGQKLNISVHTSKTHRKRIICKLGFSNTAAMVKFAVENGIA